MVRLMIAIVMVLLPGISLAATETRTVHAEATGIDREQAIFNALGDAVRQVRGAQISASRQVQSALSRMSVRTGDGREASLEIQKGSSSKTSVSAEGLISGYRVLSVSNAQGGGKLARLTVDVPVYRSPGNPDDGRWRMAVYPVWSARPFYEVGNVRLSREEVSDRMTQAITEALVQSRRFAMLSRDKEHAINAERLRMAGDDVPVEEKAMLGNELGAEYLVTAQVTDLTLGIEETVSGLTGERSRKQTGALVLEARVLVPATGAIVWTHTFNLQPEHLGLEIDDTRGGIQSLFERAGQEVALSVIDVVWPPLVEGLQGEELIINMGGELMKKGQRWEVFSLGNSVQNSHTGQKLGRSEALVATVEVTRSTPKMAYARIVEGDVQGKGHVLRRPAHVEGQDPAEAIRGTRKRTCLPIDPC
ncbi:Curli production assembly/transport component CsgG [Marinobacter pelagius]|uniref:Curli production assembly/transport component CsgG n=2 Tax=Marinobacter pelagius TaxID=379482 RepID=A0A1I4VAR6_9GAMM|nr:Curli production assembly/transport component CsgG [Marinobacter pelagius]